MIMAIDPPVVATRLIRERQFLDQTALGEQMEGPVNGAIGDFWITSPNALEDLAGCQVAIGLLDCLENRGALRCVPVFARDRDHIASCYLSRPHCRPR